jgi:hypothetical protein
MEHCKFQRELPIIHKDLHDFGKQSMEYLRHSYESSDSLSEDPIL